MDQFHNFHAKIQTLSNLNERIVNSHFPDEIGRCISRPQRPPSQGGWSRRSSSGIGFEELSTTPAMAAERGPPTIRPRLPMEVVEIILCNLSKPKRQLLPVLLANKALHSVAIAQLYREMVESRPAQCITLVRHLLNHPSVHRHVRKLDINISSIDCPTGNFYRLMQRLLQHTTMLTHLSLDFPKAHSPVWILDGCTFSLRQFSTSMHSSHELARFLDGQPHITQLTLRGFQSDALKSLPYIYMDIANSISPGFLVTRDSNYEQFVLGPESLKKLGVFNAIHAGPTVELLLAACPFLSSFKKLKYITCVATSTEESTYAEEKEIAEKWHEKCSTLKTIILPRGRVWFHKPSLAPSAGSWECLED
ncbi:hypothetical protein MD484_g3098, partial [Candolleomyces efflorescens]